MPFISWRGGCIHYAIGTREGARILESECALRLRRSSCTVAAMEPIASACRSFSLAAEVLREPGGSSEYGGIRIGVAEDLQAERHAVEHEQRQRQGRNAKQRGRHRELRTAGRLQACGRRAGRRQRYAGVAGVGKLGIERADAGPLLEAAAIIGERHGLRLLAAIEQRLAEQARIARGATVDEPARLPGVDAVRQREGLGELGVDRRHVSIVIACSNLDARCRQPMQRLLHAGLGSLGGEGPAGSLQEGEPPRLHWLRRALGPDQTGRASIATDALYDLVGDLPGVLQRGAQDAGATLALVVVTALTVERANSRLVAHATAEARRPQRRADHLRAKANTDHAARDCRRRAAARSTGCALEIPGVAGTARLGRGELGGHGLAEDDGAGLS